jgi:hypothetical protein
MFVIPASLEAPEAQPGQRNALGLSTRDKHYASNTQAAIRRADFERYKQQIRPIEDRLIWMVDNPELRANSVQSARDTVARSFRQSGAALRGRLADQGLSLTPQQQAAITRRQDLSQGLADVTAATRASRAFDERNARILTGGGQRYGLGGGAQ